MSQSRTGNTPSNVAQVAGTTTDTNSGNKSAGTLRVVLATDQPALTNKLLVTPDLPSGASTAAKQPALGTAGTASADVLSVQGIASMTALLTTASGNVASDGVDSGNPVKIGMHARTSDLTAVSSADRVDAVATILGKQIVKLDAIPDNSWNYAAPAGGLVTTTGVTAKAAAGAGIRNYVKSAQVINSHATISSEVVINDGAAGTTLWRGWVQAAGGGISVTFDPPLRGTANTLVEIKEITATATAGILVSLQGFVGAE